VYSGCVGPLALRHKPDSLWIGVYMPQLQVPTQIWLSATPDERDSFYLSAGFNPDLPVVDNGTDVNFVRFRQDPVLSALPEPILVGIDSGLAAGDDLRDLPVVAQPVSIVADEFGNGYGPSGLAGAGISIAGRALKLILGGGGGRLTASIWNSLPPLVRTALVQVGIFSGSMIAFNGDIPFITLPGQEAAVTPFIGPPEAPVDIQIGGTLPSPMMGVQVVGSWNTNPTNPSQGVTFYRLSNGWLAVQNKKGRWKTWKPKRPIVLYASGASNLKTMLRADRALNKQAKKIAAMLNRRAPRKKTSAKPGIIIESGPGNVISR